MKRAVLCLCLMTLWSHWLWGQKGDDTLLPPDGFAKGWERSEPAKVFKGADLYGHINGGSELFLEFGFEQLTVQNFKKAEYEASVEIYRMTDALAAFGIYLMKCGKENPEPGFKERHTLNTYQLTFVHGPYFVVVNNLEGEPRIVNDIIAFAAFVANKMPPAFPVRPDTGLPAEGQIEGSLRLIRGAYALQEVFTLGDGDILSLGGKRAAATADYEAGGRAYTLIAVDYPSAANAQAAWKHLVRNLDRFLTLVSAQPTRLIFKDHSGDYGVINQIGNRIEITVHLKDKPSS